MSQTTQTTLDETMAKLERQETLPSNASELMFDPNEVVVDDENLQDAQIVTPDSVYMPIPNLEASFLQPYEEEPEQGGENWILARTSRPCRHRYISEYKEKKLGCATDADRQRIAECKTVRDWADCKLDAELYDKGEDMRMDEKTYICLYGLHPSIVNKINYTPTIMALNEYAGLVASEDHLVTPIFHRRFAEFLSALKESGYAHGYTKEQSSASYKAYSAFVDAMETEVEDIPEKKGLWRY